MMVTDIADEAAGVFHIWGNAPDGLSVLLRVHDFQPYFYIAGPLQAVRHIARNCKQCAAHHTVSDSLCTACMCLPGIHTTSLTTFRSSCDITVLHFCTHSFRSACLLTMHAITRSTQYNAIRGPSWLTYNTATELFFMQGPYVNGTSVEADLDEAACTGLMHALNRYFQLSDLLSNSASTAACATCQTACA